MLMPHRRPQQQLHENQANHRHQDALERRKTGPVAHVHPLPPSAGNQCDRTNQNQEQLRHGTVNQSQVLIDLSHPQPAEYPLHHDQNKRTNPQQAHPFAGFFRPKPDRQADGQKPDKRRHQPVGMLLKYAELPEPLVEWHQKHVVSVGSRPIRHGHPHPLARHQSANPNKCQCRQCSEHGEPVQPRVILRSCRHQKPKQTRKKQVS